MRHPRPWLVLFLASVAACVAVSPQSFWIDEAQTALKALEPTLHGWWHALYSEHNSNLQLPLYMLYVWGWARLFGVSELALRAANIPWFFAGLFAIFHFLRRHSGLRAATLLVYCLHPFVWYYLDEARPYLMQLSGALLVSGCAFSALDGEAITAAWWWLFAAGLTVLCGAGILGAPWAIAITLLLILRPCVRRSAVRSGLPALAVFTPILALLALYFAWTIRAKISTGYLGVNNLPSMLSVFYEQLGFLGLGPGRVTLRAASLSSLPPFLLPLCLLGLPLAWALALAIQRRFAAILLMIASPVALIFALGFIRHARILARHLTPLFPFLLIAEAYGVLLLWKSGRLPGRAAAALIVIALTLSSIEIRFAPRHAKDDNRGAIALATESLAHGKTVWWAADVYSAGYYHFPLGEAPGAARWVQDVPPGTSKLPDEIFLSKPDLFDPTGSIARFIDAHHYRLAGTLPAFTIWEAPYQGQ